MNPWPNTPRIAPWCAIGAADIENSVGWGLVGDGKKCPDGPLITLMTHSASMSCWLPYNSCYE